MVLAARGAYILLRLDSWLLDLCAAPSLRLVCDDLHRLRPLTKRRTPLPRAQAYRKTGFFRHCHCGREVARGVGGERVAVDHASDEQTTDKSSSDQRGAHSVSFRFMAPIERFPTARQ